jgi:hypothetical protein
MQKRDDETLVAYLDGEIDTAGAARQVEAWLDSDLAARDRLAALARRRIWCAVPMPKSLTSRCRIADYCGARRGRYRVKQRRAAEAARAKMMPATTWWIRVAAAAGCSDWRSAAPAAFGTGLLSSQEHAERASGCCCDDRQQLARQRCRLLQIECQRRRLDAG